MPTPLRLEMTSRTMEAMTRAKSQPRQRRQRGTGGVRTRPDGRWEATFTLRKDGSSKRGRRLYGYGSNPTEAIGDLERKKDLAKSGFDSADAQTTIAEWLVMVMDSKPEIAYSTKRAYWQSIDGYLIPHLGAATLASCDPKMIQAKINRIAKKNGASAAHHAHAVLRMALSEADRLEIVPRNAAKRVKPPTVVRDVPVPWTIEEARAFLRAIVGHRLQALFHIAATSGPRPSELLGLTWSSIDAERRKITINKKLVTPRKSDGDPFTDPVGVRNPDSRSDPPVRSADVVSPLPRRAHSRASPRKRWTGWPRRRRQGPRDPRPPPPAPGAAADRGPTAAPAHRPGPARGGESGDPA